MEKTIRYQKLRCGCWGVLVGFVKVRVGALGECRKFARELKADPEKVEKALRTAAYWAMETR
jgi:hypothetical protein